MPNGKPLSGASGTAEFASSAIAFRRIDYWLKPPRWNADRHLARHDARGVMATLCAKRTSARAPTKCSN
jgi:hypothetical protein